MRTTTTQASEANLHEQHVVEWQVHNLAAHLAEALDDEAPVKTMSKQLRDARVRYVDTVASSGRLSLHNGDEVAAILAGATPEQVMRAAEILKDLPAGTLATRYERLNPGQKRMNSGNQIRSLVKKGEITAEDVRAAITA